MNIWSKVVVLVCGVILVGCGGKGGEEPDLRNWVPDGGLEPLFEACDGGCGEGRSCVKGPTGKPVCVDAELLACQGMECGTGQWGECYEDYGCWDIWTWCACPDGQVCTDPATGMVADEDDLDMLWYGACVPPPAVCGNGVCDAEKVGEGCSSCSKDCVCPQGEYCGPDGTCKCLSKCGESDECGDNGCGGSCGECGEGEECVQGVSGGMICFNFAEVCPEICAEVECGEVWNMSTVPGCFCGECEEGQFCEEDEFSGGKCVCLPDCTAKACGDDGCGGSCGECPAECTAHNQCGPDELCLGGVEDWVPATQVCGLCGIQEACQCATPTWPDQYACTTDADCEMNLPCGNQCMDCPACPKCVHGWCAYETGENVMCLCTGCA